MIEIKTIEHRGATIDCPHCRKALVTLFPNGPKQAFDRYLYDDGDVRRSLSEIPRLHGSDIEVRLGTCFYCTGDYFGVTARFIDAILDDEFIQIYFLGNGDRGEESNFIGQNSEEEWTVTRFDTPLGPMLEHQFGPCAAKLTGIHYPGNASTFAGPSELAEHFLLAQWNELRKMPKALGLHKQHLGNT
jgi:hypothetical protein